MRADPLLAPGEDAHPEVPRRNQQRVHAGRLPDGDDAQCRIERARHEGAHRHGAHLTVIRSVHHGRHDRDAAGE